MEIRRATANIGADVHGLDLSQPLGAAEVAEIRAALLEHLVLFFRDQRKLSVDEHVRFGRYFGEIDLPLFRTPSSPAPEVIVLDQKNPRGEGADNWHADNTYMPAPPMGSILQAHLLPSIGGDTCFANMYTAYDALSPAIRGMVDGLFAVHSLAQMAERTKHVMGASLRDKVDEWPPVLHPVVAVHPETGRRLLNVNANWTVAIDGVSRAESDALLRLLYDHVRSPEYQVRLRWNAGDVAFWDNRAVQHYAVADYRERRMMQRVTIAGSAICGIAEAERLRNET